MTYTVEFDNVSQLYGDVRAVGGVSIAIRDSELFSILGPSGSGKTTCLRLTVGFEQLSGGAISVFGKLADNLPSQEQDVNTVSQNYALFSRISILDDAAYRLMVKGISKKQRYAVARETLEKIALGFVYQRESSQFSGGRRQRVVIVRTLVSESRILLSGEPFNALNLKSHEQIQLGLKKLRQSLGITFIFVTHNQGEASSMSDRVAVFNDGRIEQVDPPRDLHMCPRIPFVARFVGTPSVFDGLMAEKLRGIMRNFALRSERIHPDAPGEP